MQTPTILHIPPQAIPATPSKPRQRYLIFFITGNPGLIDYYQLFLSRLHANLSADAKHVDFEVFGRSLSGFETDTAGSYPAGPRPPFGLRQQIEGVEWALWDHVKGVREQQKEEGRRWRRRKGLEEQGGVADEQEGDPKHDDADAVPDGAKHLDSYGEEQQPPPPPPKVILIGHSVGAYIALEVLSRWRARLRRQNGISDDSDSNTDTTVPITGTIALFPTVTHIAASPRGQTFTPLLRLLPQLPLLAGLVSHLLSLLLPSVLLLHLVRLATRMPAPGARTTAAFLASPCGVRQALHMAREEMSEITEDRWDDEVWGAAEEEEGDDAAGVKRAKLFFLFGEGDHWVADETRDDLMRARGRRKEKESEGEGEDEAWKPLMEVDETGVPHGFCIQPEHSIFVADKVKQYVEAIVRSDI